MSTMKTIYFQIKNPQDVDREVRSIVKEMHPEFDFSRYATALTSVLSVFDGTAAGFLQCDTVYHDRSHTMATLLATTRLLHGIHTQRQPLPDTTIELALIAALFHDTGYIRTSDEAAYSGGYFSRTHIDRSLRFLDDHATRNGISVSELLSMESMIQCTDLNSDLSSILFTNLETMLAGHALGTADILAQMGDDIYLEKLPYLFHEFREGGISKFTSEYDLLSKTLMFSDSMRNRLKNDLSDLVQYMPAHFMQRYAIERDFYSESIDKNMLYLANVLASHGESYERGLRRSLDRPDHPLKLSA